MTQTLTITVGPAEIRIGGLANGLFHRYSRDRCYLTQYPELTWDWASEGITIEIPENFPHVIAEEWPLDSTEHWKIWYQPHEEHSPSS